MRNVNILFVLLTFISSIGFSQFDADTNFMKINFMAEATIRLNYLNFSDTVVFSSQFINFFPRDYIEGPQKKLFGNGTDFIKLKIQIPQQVDLNVIDFQNNSNRNDKKTDQEVSNFHLTCFLIPFDTLTLTVDYAKRDSLYQSITYDGKYAVISNYYKEKAKHFSGKDFRYQKGIWANTMKDLAFFKTAIDSLTRIELDYLEEFDAVQKLPEWFFDFETADLQYFAMSIKLGQPVLLGFLNGSKVMPPDDYYAFSKELPLQNEKAIGSMYYFLSLKDYFTEVWEPEHQKNYPDSLKYVHWYDDMVLYAHSLFSPYISDILLAMELDYLIDVNRISEDKYSILIDAINDPALKKYLESHYINKEILKPGDDAPGFYLKNLENKYCSLTDFRDSIIYISFWSTGCKPCLKEIPEENRLVDVFSHEKVKIISICMSSYEESWRNVSEKYQLRTINLFSNQNWEKILEESYDIKSFPHYVIIGKNGKIIENKTIRPSAGAEEMIKSIISK